MNSGKKYVSSALMLLISSVVVKAVGAVYKIPLTAFIGAVGRGYFATAYNLYIPLHAILMGALPVALSRTISKYNAKNNLKMVSSVRKSAFPVFVLIGITGSLLLLLAAKPYAVLISSSPKSVYTILMLAPNIFFCCLASCYRGYYEGYMNMLPTSVSQTLEAVFKAVFGLLFAKMSMNYMLSEFLQYGSIFGTALNSEKEALSFMYPFSSAAAMLGVTVGSVFSLAFVIVYDLINKPPLPKASGREGRKALLSFSLPIFISCGVQSVFQFLDTASVQYALQCLPLSALKAEYSEALSISKTALSDTVTYIYGLFCTALDFKNLIPGITMALGVCAVPAICREYESKNSQRCEELINTVFKYTSLLAVYLSSLTALCSKDILNVFYNGSSPDVVLGCEKLVIAFAVSAPLYALASVAVFSVQALGVPEKSVLPYAISGIIRCVLNMLLVMREDFMLYGAVISGAAGYALMLILNMRIIKRTSRCAFSLKNIAVKPVMTGIFAVFLCKFILLHINFLKIYLVKLLIEIALFSTIYYILCNFFKVFNLSEIFCVLNFKKNGSNT